ncbi:MAG: metallophosphoesterase, partial [Chitinophagaceae bacterium]
WHAGDFGGNDVIASLKQLGKPLKGVLGNIDDRKIISEFPETLVFHCEKLKIMMKHIGGYPPKFNKSTIAQVIAEKPNIFISGHSHILKIMYNEAFNCLHINPGAAGKQGWHKVRTMVQFTIDDSDIKDCNVIELGDR